MSLKPINSTVFFQNDTNISSSSSSQEKQIEEKSSSSDSFSLPEEITSLFLKRKRSDDSESSKKRRLIYGKLFDETDYCVSGFSSVEADSAKAETKLIERTSLSQKPMPMDVDATSTSASKTVTMLEAEDLTPPNVRMSPPEDLVPSVHKLKCPPTPRVARKVDASKLTPFAKASKEMSEKIAFLKLNWPFSIQIGNKILDVKKFITQFPSGNYSDVCLVEGSGFGVEDKVFVIKIFKERWYSENQKIFNRILASEVDQYPRVLQRFANKECIARYYDLDVMVNESENEQLFNDPATAMNHGCHIVKYVPYEYPIDQSRRELYTEDDPLYSADEQLKEIFRVAYLSKEEPFDLTWGNVRMNEDGMIVVVDPMYPILDQFDVDCFNLTINQCLISFAPEGSERYKFLDPRT